MPKPVYWTEARIRKAAKGFKTAKAFKMANESAYKRMNSSGLNLFPSKRHRYTDAELIAIMEQHPSRTALFKAKPGAYHAANERDLLRWVYPSNRKAVVVKEQKIKYFGTE